ELVDPGWQQALAEWRGESGRGNPVRLGLPRYTDPAPAGRRRTSLTRERRGRPLRSRVRLVGSGEGWDFSFARVRLLGCTEIRGLSPIPTSLFVRRRAKIGWETENGRPPMPRLNEAVAEDWAADP